MSIDVEALATALALNGIAVENVASIGNADQWLPDRELAAKVAAEYARLVPAEDEGLSVHVNTGAAHDRAMAWSEGHTAGFEEGRAAAAEDEHPLVVRDGIGTCQTCGAVGKVAATTEPWTDPKG